MEEIRAGVKEVFSSIQGEGIFAGAKQIFVRFSGCNLSCAFCDEEHKEGARDYSAAELMEEVRALARAKGSHHSVSLTGGEPLLHTPFLKYFLPLLKSDNHKVYLETNGTLPSNLRDVIASVDIIAMDFKLPSSTEDRAYWNEHLEFLKVAFQKRVFVKAVITPATMESDIKKVSELIEKVDRNIPLILQPATPVKRRDRAVAINRLVELMETASGGKLENIRIVPQIHKLLKVK
jgi:organic radical activating enzyme